MLVVFCFFKGYNNSRLDLKSVDLLLLFFLPGFTFSITCTKIRMKNSGRMHTYRQFKSLRWRRIRFCFVCSFVLGQRKRSILIVKYLFGSGNFAIQVSLVVRMEPVVYILSFIFLLHFRCPSGYTGKYCEKRVPTLPPSKLDCPLKCLNGGTCVLQEEKPKCKWVWQQEMIIDSEPVGASEVLSPQFKTEHRNQ